jgi:hypothetical protein
VSTEVEDRELTITIKQVYHEGVLSHWLASIEFDGEQLYEETGVDLRDAADRVYYHVWREDTTISPAWRDASLPWPEPLKNVRINGSSPDDWD